MARESGGIGLRCAGFSKSSPGLCSDLQKSVIAEVCFVSVVSVTVLQENSFLFRVFRAKTSES